MSDNDDPRLIHTRKLVFEAALSLLKKKGITSVTYGSVAQETGLSRSTIYRNWPTLDDLRMETFSFASTLNYLEFSSTLSRDNLREELTRILTNLLTALNETDWGEIVPHLIASASNDDRTRELINSWIAERKNSVLKAFDEAVARGEISKASNFVQLAEIAIAVPYFKKLLENAKMDQDWLKGHVDSLCEQTGIRYKDSRS